MFGHVCVFFFNTGGEGDSIFKNYVFVEYVFNFISFFNPWRTRAYLLLRPAPHRAQASQVLVQDGTHQWSL